MTLWATESWLPAMQKSGLGQETLLRKPATAPAGGLVPPVPERPGGLTIPQPEAPVPLDR